MICYNCSIILLFALFATSPRRTAANSIPLTTEEWAAAEQLTATWDGVAREGSPGMYQLDIDLGGSDVVSDDVQQNAVIHETYRWHYGEIPYVMSPDLPEATRIAVANAILKYHSSTGIRFVQRTDQPDYVEIVSGPGCFSQLGRQGGRQVLSLGEGCGYSGIVQHELMHVAGFWHEVTRPDRDDYISINWENMNDASQQNFDIASSSLYTTQDLPYDYNSILHNGETDFTNNGEPTITVLNQPATANIGQRNELSPLDVQKIDKMYSAACLGHACLDRLTMIPGMVSKARESTRDEYISLRGDVMDFCINEWPADINDHFVMSTQQYVGWTESISTVNTKLISGTATDSIGIHLHIDHPYELNAEDRGPIIRFNVSIITTDDPFRWRCTRHFPGSDWCGSYMDDTRYSLEEPTIWSYGSDTFGTNSIELNVEQGGDLWCRWTKDAAATKYNGLVATLAINGEEKSIYEYFKSPFMTSSDTIEKSWNYENPSLPMDTRLVAMAIRSPISGSHGLEITDPDIGLSTDSLEDWKCMSLRSSIGPRMSSDWIGTDFDDSTWTTPRRMTADSGMITDTINLAITNLYCRWTRKTCQDGETVDLLTTNFLENDLVNGQLTCADGYTVSGDSAASCEYRDGIWQWEYSDTATCIAGDTTTDGSFTTPGATAVGGATVSGTDTTTSEEPPIQNDQVSSDEQVETKCDDSGLAGAFLCLWNNMMNLAGRQSKRKFIPRTDFLKKIKIF